MRRTAVFFVGVVVALAALCGRVERAAAEDDLPDSKIGILLGGRSGLGSLADQFGVGFVGGIEAAYQPTTPERRWSFGVNWSMSWGRFGASEFSSISGSLNLLDTSAGVRLRFLMSERDPWFAVVTGGGTLLRTSVPIDPAGERSYFGGYAGAGMDIVQASYEISFETRYGIIGGNTPNAISFMLGIGFGG